MVGGEELGPILQLASVPTVGLPCFLGGTCFLEDSAPPSPSLRSEPFLICTEDVVQNDCGGGFKRPSSKGEGVQSVWQGLSLPLTG